MKLYSLFSSLCRITTPHGHEAYTWSFIPYINYIDEKQNVWCWVKNKDGTYPTVMFSCHCDTAGGGKPAVTGVHIKKGIVRSGGDTVLGADDKTGMAIMIKMIENKIPGLYIFHSGEECGGIGSGYLSKEWLRYMDAPDADKNKLTIALKRITQCVAFDRRSTGSIITHQGGTRTCSDEYGLALAAELKLGHKLDQGGSFTDTKNYVKLFSECTNISAGYDNEHCHTESLNWEYFENLQAACLKVDWQGLPAKRDKTKEESRWQGTYLGGYNSGHSYGGGKATTWNEKKWEKKGKKFQNRWVKKEDGGFKLEGEEIDIPNGSWVMTFNMGQTGSSDFGRVVERLKTGNYIVTPYDNTTGLPLNKEAILSPVDIYQCKTELEEPVFPINWETQFEVRPKGPTKGDTQPPKAVPRQVRGAQNLLKPTRVLVLPPSPTTAAQMNFCQTCQAPLTREGKLLQCCSRCGVELSAAQRDALSLS